METKDFFYLYCRYLRGSVQVESVGLEKDEKGLDNHYNLIKARYEGIAFPVVFRLEWGKKFTDILNTGWSGLYLISEHLKKLLEENHFTGWTTYPIVLRDKNGMEIKGYHGFSTTGVCGLKSYANVPIIEKKFVPDGPIIKCYKGINLEFNKWDGSDFFTPQNSYDTIITEKVAKTLKKNKISNLSLINIAEFEMPVD